MVDRLPVGRPVERDRDRVRELRRRAAAPRVVDDHDRRADVELRRTAAPWPRSSVSMSGWKSRWSWLRLVNAATAKRTPSTRRSSSACEETSIAHAAVAGVEHRAERGLEVDRLRRRAHRGPLLAADDRGHAAEQAARAGRRPRAGGAARNVVVVLPLVPVMPTTWSVGRRVAVEARGGAGHRGAHVVDEHLGHAEAERALDDERGRAARHGVGGEVVPVAGEAGDAEEQRAGPHRPVVVGQGDDVHVGPVAEQVAQRHARATLVGRGDGGPGPPSTARGQPSSRTRRKTRSRRRRRRRGRTVTTRTVARPGSADAALLLDLQRREDVADRRRSPRPASGRRPPERQAVEREAGRWPVVRASADLRPDGVRVRTRRSGATLAGVAVGAAGRGPAGPCGPAGPARARHARERALRLAAEVAELDASPA